MCDVAARDEIFPMLSPGTGFANLSGRHDECREGKQCLNAS
jgi:hypothetical protein